MKKSIMIVLAALSTCFGAATCASGITISFTYTSSSSSLSASGTLDLGPLVGVNAYRIVGGSITVGADNYSLDPAGTGTLGSPANPPPGAFLTDNVYYDPANPVLDNWGALFSGLNGTQVNLWGNSPDNYSLWLSLPNVGYVITDDGGTLLVAQVPECGLTVALLGCGLLGVLCYRKFAI